MGDASSSIYSSVKWQITKPKDLKSKQHSKVVCQRVMSKAVKCYSENSIHCFANFTIQLIPFLHVVYFGLVIFFNFATIHHSGYHIVLYPSGCVMLVSFPKAIHLLVMSTKDSGVRLSSD